MTEITETPTETITIDHDQALALMKRAVEEKGADYIYQPREFDRDEYGDEIEDGGPACVYVKDGEPSCLVGHALHYAGITIDELAVLDACSTGTSARSIPQVIHRLKFTTGARYAFTAGQSSQDAGREWGASLATAESESEGLE